MLITSIVIIHYVSCECCGWILHFWFTKNMKFRAFLSVQRPTHDPSQLWGGIVSSIASFCFIFGQFRASTGLLITQTCSLRLWEVLVSSPTSKSSSVLKTWLNLSSWGTLAWILDIYARNDHGLSLHLLVCNNNNNNNYCLCN